MSLISLSKVTKSYGGLYALRDINLVINAGEFIMLLGPNGAGKSTLLKILSTVLKPTEGEMSVSDSPTEDRAYIRSRLGFVSHESYLYENLTAYENLIFFGNLYGMNRTEERAESLLNKMHLHNRSHEIVRNYSQGMKQRLALCRGIVHDPGIVILDEPFNSLDITGINIVTNLLRELKAEGKTILMSTHNHELSTELADRIIVLVEGQLKLNSDSLISRDKLSEIYTQ